MLFKRSIFAIILLFSFASLHSQEIEIYATDSIAIGKIAEFSQGTIGHGLALFYDIEAIPFLGLCARLEHSINLLNSNESISSWSNISYCAGVTALFNLTDFLSLKPELDFGGSLSILRPKTINPNLYNDILLQLSCSFDFFSPAKPDSNISFMITPFYRLLPEKDNIGQYAGINFGIKTGF